MNHRVCPTACAELNDANATDCHACGARLLPTEKEINPGPPLPVPTSAAGPERKAA